MQTGQRIRIGDRLLEAGLITDDHIEVALSEQRRAYRPLGQILVSLGFVSAASSRSSVSSSRVRSACSADSPCPSTCS